MLAHFWGPREKAPQKSCGFSGTPRESTPQHPAKQHKNTARDFSLAVFVVVGGYLLSSLISSLSFSASLCSIMYHFP